MHAKLANKINSLQHLSKFTLKNVQFEVSEFETTTTTFRQK